MSNALVGPFIQASGYTKGRRFVEAQDVQFLVVHSAEGAKDELDLGNFFKNNSRGSSNCGIGQDGGYCGYVNYGDTPWTNPPLSQESDTVELCGFAHWTREEWLACPAMLETLAAWIAWRAAVRGIPIVLLTADDIGAGKRGIADHRTVNLVYKQSKHWDVGYDFPWDVVIPRARELAGVVEPPIEPPQPPPPPPPPVQTNPFGRALLTEDGLMGAKTIEEAQEQIDTPADGVISYPESTFVKAVQRFLNAHGAKDWDGKSLKVDGIGLYSNALRTTPKTRTCWALQSYLGTAKDGVMDGPPNGSAAVRELQHRLNSGNIW